MHILNKNSINCTAGIPCIYETNVDLRIIVITYDRTSSVMKLLNNLQYLDVDEDLAVLEIWIDRNAKNEINNDMYNAVSQFKWNKGVTRVHNQTSHVGLLGQWIDTWRPKVAPPFEKKNMSQAMYQYHPQYSKEIALILEDDMMISPQAYKFIKAVHKKYSGRPDYAGVSLQSDEAKALNSGKPLRAPINESVLMFVCVGTWGFSPSPQYWAEFQDWYHYARTVKGFWPYVDDTEPGKWFRGFVAQGTADNMWEMWFIYFATKKRIYTVYSNLRYVNGDKADSCVSYNRREIGLHFPTKGPENLCKLLEKWDTKYESMLPDNPIKLDWFGNVNKSL
ncbi:hypothetical protein HELRODRAFT_173601 [Helobdella robusta]|uniref:Glycosyl transferase 64 domain-containing protein n=1 Tax=Helobdella robusta TaxID=6412 RepID=T1F707_HELRO|nr:hypothetical protein HELRODRAFT_173601 [Helobdella robusta]ESO03315.1 hypothetical protein HELRODRAFT_173601 [Helobdella robusta]